MKKKNDDKVPDIFTIDSVRHGLNKILENAQTQSSLPLHKLQEDFLVNHKSSKYESHISTFKNEISQFGEVIELQLKQSFNNSKYHHGRNLSELEKVLKNHPVIFAGGGGS